MAYKVHNKRDMIWNYTTVGTSTMYIFEKNINIVSNISRKCLVFLQLKKIQVGLHSFNHRLNMEVDLQSLFGLHVT